MKDNSQSFGLLKVVCGLLVVGVCIGLDGKGVANLLGAGIRLAADSPDDPTKQCKMTFGSSTLSFNQFAVVQAVPETQQFIGVSTAARWGQPQNLQMFFSKNGPCGPWLNGNVIIFEEGDIIEYLDIYHYKDAPSWMYEFWTTFLINGDQMMVGFSKHEDMKSGGAVPYMFNQGNKVYAKAFGLSEDVEGGFYTNPNIVGAHIYKMLGNTIWQKSHFSLSGEVNGGRPLKFNATVNTDAGLPSGQIEVLNTSNYTVWGVKDWANHRGWRGRGSGYTSKRYLGSFYHKGQQHDLMYGWKEDSHRLFVHTDLGADIGGDIAMVDGLVWPAPKGQWGGSAMNLFEHSKIATGTEKLYIIISDPQGVQNPVVLTLDWEIEKPSVGAFCPT